MGIRFFLSFLLFFIMISVYLFYQKVESINIVKNSKNIPMMEMIDSTIYNITYDGINAVLSSKVAKKFRNRIELEDIYSNKKDKNNFEELWAKKGVLKNNILTLRGDVLYKNLKGNSLRSNIIIYYLKKDILISKAPFVANYEKSVIKGSSFIYYKKRKKLLAENIIADIKTEDK